jgi:hypothetical protein
MGVPKNVGICKFISEIVVIQSAAELFILFYPAGNLPLSI